jgi:hypothetical protein
MGPAQLRAALSDRRRRQRFFGLDGAAAEVAADEAAVEKARVDLVSAQRALQLAQGRQKPADALVAAFKSMKSDDESNQKASSVAALAALYGQYATDDSAQLAAAQKVADDAAAQVKAAQAAVDAAQRTLDGYGAALDAAKQRMQMLKVGIAVVVVAGVAYLAHRRGYDAQLMARVRAIRA